MLKKKNEKNIGTNKKSSRSYMYSYEWNYMVLEIVDYLETRFAEIESGGNPDPDPWKNFQDYCSQNNLNWRVIRKMIEFSINTPFESERELANHESFKALVKAEGESVRTLDNKEDKPEKESLLILFFNRGCFFWIYWNNTIYNLPGSSREGDLWGGIYGEGRRE